MGKNEKPEEPAEPISPERLPAEPKIKFGASTRPKEERADEFSDRWEENQVNEDSFFANPETGAFGVFDGIGGYQGGAVAAETAKREIAQKTFMLAENLSPEKTEKALKDIFSEINQDIAEEARERGLKFLGTTASVVKLAESERGEKYLVWANVGDSRIYVFSKEGRLRRISADDNLFSEIQLYSKEERGEMRLEVKDKKNMLVELRSRLIIASMSKEERAAAQERLDDVKNPEEELNEEEKVLFWVRNVITNALGYGFKGANAGKDTLKDGDLVLIVSDGIHDNLTKKEIEDILAAASSPEEAAENLTAAARKKSRMPHKAKLLSRSKPDDMTALVIETPGKQAKKNE